MASSDNLIASSTETWAFRNAFDNAWISEAFSRDTEILTRALQKSISNNITNTNNNNNNNNNNDYVHVVDDEVYNVNVSGSLQKVITLSSPPPSQQGTQTQSVSSSGGGNGSETETVSKKRAAIRTVVGPPNKVAKRKSRASKRTPTTFITADPENFRQMVQQVTGVRFGSGSGHVVKPEPHRPGGGVVNRLQTGCLLPTLDTSAFLLDHHHQQQQQGLGLGPGPAAVEFGPPAVVAEAAGPRFDFDGFSGFPTLESWN